MNHETSKGSPMKLLCGNVTPSINRLTEPTLRTRCCQPRYSHKAITTAAQCAFGCSGTTYCSALEVRHQRPGVRQCRFQAIALCSDFSHFLAIILHFNLKVDFELSIDKGCHCAAASNLHSLPAQFAKACRGRFQLQLLKQRNEVFADLVLPADVLERQWPQLQALYSTVLIRCRSTLPMAYCAVAFIYDAFSR